MAIPAAWRAAPKWMTRSATPVRCKPAPTAALALESLSVSNVVGAESTRFATFSLIVASREVPSAVEFVFVVL